MRLGKLPDQVIRLGVLGLVAIAVMLWILRRQRTVASGRANLVVAGLLLLLSVACDSSDGGVTNPNSCIPGTPNCLANPPQLCGSDGQWHTYNGEFPICT